MNRQTFWRLAFSAVMTGLFVFRARAPTLFSAGSDGVTIALLILIALPWLPTLVSRAELPGGWKLEFREVKGDLATVRGEVDTLKFIVAHLIGDFEYEHLRKLEGKEPFPFEKTGPFVEELRHLRSLGLVRNIQAKSMREIPDRGPDLHAIIEVTEPGKTYLRIRSSWS